MCGYSASFFPLVGVGGGMSVFIGDISWILTLGGYYTQKGLEMRKKCAYSDIFLKFDVVQSL